MADIINTNSASLTVMILSPYSQFFNFFSSKNKANDRNQHATFCFGLMNYTYRMPRAFLKESLICFQTADRWPRGHNVRWRELDPERAALKCDYILFILNSHKASRLDDTLPSCQSMCHCKLGSLTTPDGGKIIIIKKSTKGNSSSPWQVALPTNYLFPLRPQRRGVHLHWRCRAPLPLPPSSSHKILLHYISGECHKFCLFFFSRPKECAKKCELTCT